MKLGDKFDISFVVNEKVYRGFIDIFNDQNPLHTNSVFAQSKGFESEVMHGNILGGFLSYFIGECLPIKNVIIHSQDIKYHKPIYLNDQVIFKAEISEIFESVNAIEFKYFFENIQGLKLAKGKIQIGII